MSLDVTHAEAARRLSAAIDEMRAEVTVTRDAIRAVMAEDGQPAEHLAELAECASRLVGFAESGQGDTPSAESLSADAAAAPHPMRRITDWAEGVLHALPPGSHSVTRRRAEQY